MIDMDVGDVYGGVVVDVDCFDMHGKSYTFCHPGGNCFILSVNFYNY